MEIKFEVLKEDFVDIDSKSITEDQFWGEDGACILERALKRKFNFCHIRLGIVSLEMDGVCYRLDGTPIHVEQYRQKLLQGEECIVSLKPQLVKDFA